MDDTAEAEGARDALVPGARADGHRLNVADADDMVAAVVDRQRVLFGRVDGVAEDLHDGFRLVVAPGCVVAETGTTAVDAKCGCRAKGRSDGEEACDGGREMHISDCLGRLD